MDDDALAVPTFNAEVIQAAIDRTAGTGHAAVIPPGVYVAHQSVELRSDVTLILAAGAVLRRNFSNGAVLAQSGDTKIVNVKVIGGRIDNPQQLPGTSISVYGDTIEITGVEVIDFYTPGLGILIVGDNNRLSGLRVVTSCTEAGAGGIRMAGGTNFLCSNCHVESGDDALQFVPLSPNAGTAVEDVSIADSQYVNCVGISAVARACVVFLENRSSSSTMTANVTNCAFIGIRGRGGSVGAMCATKGLGGQPATGRISGVQFLGVGLPVPAAPAGGSFQVSRTIDGEDPNNDGGPIEQIDFIGCTALGGSSQPGFSVENAARVRWIGGSIAAGKTSTLAVSIAASTDCEIADTTVACSDEAGATGIVVTDGSGPSERVRIAGVSILGIPDTGTGVSLNRVNTCTVASTTFLRKEAATGTTGILTAVCRNCVLEQNDMLYVDTPYTLHSSSGFISGAVGVSTSAAGTATLAAGTADVAFVVPFLNDGYAVQLTGDAAGETFTFAHRAVDGFTINSSNRQSTADVCWTALIAQFKT